MKGRDLEGIINLLRFNLLRIRVGKHFLSKGFFGGPIFNFTFNPSLLRPLGRSTLSIKS